MSLFKVNNVSQRLERLLPFPPLLESGNPNDSLYRSPVTVDARASVRTGMLCNVDGSILLWKYAWEVRVFDHPSRPPKTNGI